MNNVHIQNAKFIFDQYNYQKEIIDVIKANTEGKIITLLGKNGTGKTIFSSLTCPYKYTAYINFEHAGSADITNIMNKQKLIDYYTAKQSGIMHNEKGFLNMLCGQDSKYKVLIIDSFKEMINFCLKDLLYASKTSNFLHKQIANTFIGTVQQKLLNFYKQITARGISIIQLVGLNDDENQDILIQDKIQCFVKEAAEFIVSMSNNILILQNSKKEFKSGLAKDNGGLLGGLYEDFFKNRSIVANENGEKFGGKYIENSLIPFGISSILYELSNKNDKLANELSKYEFK